MDLFKPKKTMLFYKRIFITITILLFVIIFIYSVTTYYSSRKTIFEVQNNANMKILSQTNFNVNYICEMIQNLAYYLYYDSSLNLLLTEKNLDSIAPLDYINKVWQLNNIASISPFVDSILIYNCYNNKFISTGLDISLHNQPMVLELEKCINGEVQTDSDFTVITYTNDKQEEITLLTFILKDWSQNLNTDKSAIIISIKLDWLLSSVKTINNIGQATQNYLYIMDGNKKILNSYSDKTAHYTLTSSVIDQIVNSTDNNNIFITEENENKQLVTYIKNNKSGWYIIILQPFDIIFSQINQLRITFIYITLFVLIAAIFLALFFSRRLYKPLSDMFRHFSNKQNMVNNIIEDKDEIRYMTDLYDDALQIAITEKSKSDRNMRYVRQYVMRKILADSQSLTENEIGDYEKENLLRIDLNSNLMIVILKMDDYKLFCEYTANEKNIYKFAIQNISEEIFSQEFPNEIIDIKEDHFIVLVNTMNDAIQLKPKIHRLISEIKRVVFEFYKISLTTAYYEEISEYKDITYAYNRTLYYTNYRLIFGKGAIIKSEMICENEESKDIRLSADLEKKFLDAIKSNNDKQIDIYLDEIFNCIYKMRYDNIMYSIKHIILLIGQTISEINSKRIKAIKINMQKFDAGIENCETLVNMRELFKELMIDISGEQAGITNDKNEILIDTICAIIEENYKDINLCLQWIASTLKMSTTYIGKIFKNSKQISISEYINDVRLKHALELLENERFSIGHTFEAVGFTSQSHFFTQFKKKYGCTPKEYRMTKSISSNRFMSEFDISK